MIINSLGEVIGISVNNEELEVLGGSHPHFLTGAKWVAEARLSSRPDPRLKLLSRKAFNACVNELTSQANAATERPTPYTTATSCELAVIRSLVTTATDFSIAGSPTQEPITNL